MKNRSLNILRIMIVVLIGLYNLLVFTIFPNDWRTLSFWISYAFVMVVGLAFLGSTFLPAMFTKGTNYLFGYALLNDAFIYAVVELVVATVIMLIPAMGIWALVIQAVILVVFLFIFFGKFAGADVISKNVEKREKKVRYINTLADRVDGLTDYVNNSSEKLALTRLSEKFRYSDYASQPQLASLESEIFFEVDELEEIVMAGATTEEVMEKIKKVSALLAKRNRAINTLN